MFSESSASWLRPWLPTIDKFPSPEVQSSDCQYFLVLDSSFELSLSAFFSTLGVRAVLSLFFFFFSLPCIRSRTLLQSFLIILGPGGFFHERPAMQQQSRSFAERS